MASMHRWDCQFALPLGASRNVPSGVNAFGLAQGLELRPSSPGREAKPDAVAARPAHSHAFILGP